MVQADFSYDAAHDAAGLRARVTVLGDRPRVHAGRKEDLARAGFRVSDGGELDRLIEGPMIPLGDIVIVDCTEITGARLAALARLDERIVRAGAHLIVTTAMDALDGVFSILDRSQPQILVLPSRAEVVVAVGRVMPSVSKARVREMSEADRISLIRLSEQVDQIAQELDRMSSPVPSQDMRSGSLSASGTGARTGTMGLVASGGQEPAGRGFALPDPALVRRAIAARQARARFFDGALFADPAWDMLLDLTAAAAERQQVSVTSLCIAAGVPATTALRWVKQMVESGVFERVDDPSDKRRAFIALSERSRSAMARYFAAVDAPLAFAA